MEIKDMTIADIEERLAQIETELASDSSDVEALSAEVDDLQARRAAIKQEAQEKRDLMEKVATMNAPVIEERKEEKIMENMEIRNTPQYIEAYARYLRTGKDEEVRSLLSDNVSGGVIPVPEFVYGIIAKRLEASPILRRVRRMEARGNVKVGFEISAPAATAHTEGGAAITEEALTLGIVTLVPVTYKKFVQISDEALDSMSGEAYLSYIYDEVARGIIKAEENAVVAKILAAPQTATATAPAVAKTGSAAGAITDFVDARALLSSAAEDLVLIMTPAQYATYRGLQMAASYPVDPFDGLEVLFNDTVTAPIIGDLSGVLMNLPKGSDVEFKYDDKTLMTSDIVKILGRQPAAIEVVGNLFFAKVAA